MTATVSIIGFLGRPQKFSKPAYVEIWAKHADELRALGIDVVEQTRTAASIAWDTLHREQFGHRVTHIDNLATKLHAGPDYRDLIHDALTTDYSQTNEAIAHGVATSHAFP